MNPAAIESRRVHYDSSDRLTTPRLAGYTLDANGAVVAFTDETVYGYDANGRLTSITGPRPEQRTEIDYDATTGSRSALRRYLNGAAPSYLPWTFSNFDAQGNPQTVTDPNGRATDLHLRRHGPRPHRDAALRGQRQHDRHVHVRRRRQPHARRLPAGHGEQSRLPDVSATTP